MSTSHTVYEWREVNANASVIYDFISSDKFLKLTGADEIEFDFNVGGIFRLRFRGRGEIFGTVDEIIPYHRILLDWNVQGFNLPDEAHTRVIILIDTANKTTISVEHSAILNEESAALKRKAWGEILDELKKLVER